MSNNLKKLLTALSLSVGTVFCAADINKEQINDQQARMSGDVYNITCKDGSVVLCSLSRENEDHHSNSSDKSSWEIEYYVYKKENNDTSRYSLVNHMNGSVTKGKHDKLVKLLKDNNAKKRTGEELEAKMKDLMDN